MPHSKERCVATRGWHALALAAIVALAACPDRERPGGLTLERALAADWGDLEYEIVTGMPEDRPGGAAIVFLHGYGRTPRDYAGLAKEISAGETRVFLPVAALPHPEGRGAMWWEFIDEDWPRPYSEDPSANAWPKPSRQLPRAREAVVRLIARIRNHYRPETVVIAGHSQGAMLALDVAMVVEPPVDRVALLSGYVLLDSIGPIAKPRNQRPLVFIAHGRGDPVVGFDRAERMRRVLEQNGFRVIFEPNDGGHGVDAEVTRDLREFLAR